MLERTLSIWGFRVYLAVSITTGLLLAWCFFTDTGPAAWVNDLQAALLGGEYDPELTFVLLLVVASLLGFAAGCLFDFAMGRGQFTSPTRMELPPWDGRRNPV